MEVLDIKEQAISVSVSAASGSSSDDETTGHVTPTSTSTERNAQIGTDELLAKNQKSVISDHESFSFPTVPRSVNALSPDQVVQHHLSSVHEVSGVNVQSIIHAAWALVAGQMTGSQDIVFGVSILADDVVNSLPFRLRWARDQPVRSYLLATQKEALELSSSRAGIPGKTSHTDPAFQTLVTFGDNSQNVSIERKPAGKRYALELDVLSRDGEYLVSASSDSRVISASLVDRLLLRLDHVATQLCSCRPQQTINEVDLMTEKDLESIWNWNREVPRTLDCCVHSIIEDQVRANPEAPAICAWDGNLTYAELNGRAGQVAERLSAAGLRPGSMVPLCFDKSMWANITMLGVLKAGGALVMLDPMLPEQRLKSIVEQVEAELIVSSPSNHELSSRFCDKVEVVRPQEFGGQYHASKYSPNLSPSSTAYVQFTSGSTGVPKGSAISHKSISSAIHHQLGPLGFNTRSRVYDFSSYSFDLSIYNALTTLAAGGCLCVPTDSGRKDDLTASVLSLRSNTLTLTPSTAQTLDPEDLPDVKTIVFAGEALRVQDAAPWWKQARVVNIYGPSECTPVSTMSFNCPSPAQVTDIGVGVGMNTWIVDANDHQRLLPPGCVGELILEGPLVSTGYLRNAETNAKTYIEDPTWLLQGYGDRHPGRHARLYKTGDLVQYNENGSITFVARKDTQVKIRGQRVELGEVETRIQECLPEMLQVAAEVITTKDSNPMLVAFVLQNKSVALSPEALKLYRVPEDARHKIATKLPPYMIPAAYLSVAQMPATASGKLDRKRLCEIGAALSPEKLAEMSVDVGTKKQPSSEAERQMQDIWGQVLKFNDASLIGVEDNFFQLGGDSITAMKIVRSLREVGLELSVASILRFPVLQDIATRVVDASCDSDEAIRPFSLLSEDCDISSVLRSYHLDPGQVQDAFPCTAIQEGLVSLSSQRSGDYLTQAIIKLSHGVSIDRFCHAWSAVVEAIPLLRTRFVQGDTGLLQVVLHEQVSWKEVDDLQTYLDEDRKQPMRLGEEFTRHALAKDATGQVVYFVLTAHHALHDGWSLGMIMETLDKAYTGGKADSFPPFQKFIKYIQNEDVDQTSNFWKKALDGCESVSFPALPSSVEKPKADALVTHQLPNSVSSIDATTSTIIRAAWALVVGSMVNSDDVVFGAIVTGRHAELSGIDQIPGPTIATVPMRFHIDKSQKVTSFLSQSQKHTTDMIPHEQMGLARIAKLSSDCEQACKFQTLLVIQPEDTGIWTNSVGQLREENAMQWSSSYGLVLEVRLGHPKSTVTASFDSRLIDRSAVAGLLSGLELVIDQIASADLESVMTVKDINVLTPDDLNTIMSWNKVVPETINMCIHEVVHQRAVESPEQPAVSAWNGDLKYGELDILSTKLASHLRRIGVGKDTIVPLCFEKSMWTPVAMLAVLKAGGAFLLLDPSLPLARLEVMVRHVDTTLILATDTCANLASSLIGSVVIVGTTLFSTFDHSSDDSQFCSDSSSNAYIIFTSGSTGNPKGVVITHSNVVSAVTQHSKAFEYEKSSRIYDFSSYSFGASLNNMFCALTSGACLCIPNDDERKSNLAGSLTSLRATNVLLTPSMAEHLSPESVPTLRSLILGGEAVRAQDGNQWLGHVTLRTAYGQSETTTVATVNPHPATPEQAMSIGKGVGLVTWVVDPENHENLLPLGSIGELLLEGPAVGHGYFKDPKKTAEVYISDPHWLIRAGRRGRLYKTGDLVRYNDDGSLAYLGRKDSQVKIRGQRIELGDVEYWVREFMIEADQVVVEAVTPKGPGGRPTLAAFIKVNNAESLFEQGDVAPAKLIRIDAEVEKMLRRQLPSYMVPTIFIAMKSLPMTPTGKMNRRELRIIGGGISAEEVRSIQLANNGLKRQPVTDKEHQMQRAWSQVLGIEQRRVDLNANFFQIGGNSIVAMRVVGAARKLGLGITVAEIFQHHTLRLVAEKSRYTSNSKVSIRPLALVGNNLDASEVRCLISQACRVDPEMIEDAYPCTPLQEGLFSLASKRPGDYIMQAVLELSPKVDITMFRKAWESAIRAAAVLRTRIVHDQKLDLVQVVLNEKPEWHETTGLDDYMQADRAAHMALSTPLSRFALVKNDEGHVQWFVLSMHHALYDGWSLSLILDMVRDAYSGTDLEEAAFQPFINYVLQQVDDVKTSQYWQAELDGCEFAPYPALPASISQPVSDTVIQHLVSRPKDSYLDVTPAILARAAWAIVTSRVTNAEDVVFGVTTSGRNAPVMNIDKMPAPAFATVPVRIQTSIGQRVSDYLEAVQQQAITMIPFEQLGLHRIAKISADAQQACSFQTLFLVQQQTTETFGESDLGRWQNRDQQEFFNPYALTVEVNLLETGHLSLKATFDSRITSRWRVEKLLQRFDFVVQQIEKTRPRQTLGDISTMTEADLQQIWTWNQAVPGPAADICLHQFIEQQAEANPERSADSVKDAAHVCKGAGINTWVVDPTNANILLPPGSIGELLLEGPVVGLEYVNYPESTTGSFIHDPTWLVRGMSVQYDEHGNLDFLGHKDSQVKSRGLPHWRQQRGTGSSFHTQTQDEEFAQAAIPKRQPETPLERQLQQIWARVLDLDPGTIGLDDSFFHLGGDSVAAIKVTSEARKDDVNITVAELFQYPTLGEAAGQLASQSSEPVERIAPFALLGANVDVKKLASELASQMHSSVDIVQDAYQCTPLQVGLLSLSYKRQGGYVMQATIELDPGCDIARFKRAWETTVQATPVLRTRIFHSESAGLVQAVLNESICWNESSESLDAYLQQDRDSSMDIGEPLTRYCMIHDGSDKPKYFVWTMHHALYDGWSMKLIMEAINRAFRGEQSTTEWPQFQQFIKHLQDQDDEALERYWRESLEGFDSAPYPEVPKSLTEQPVADSSIQHSFIYSQSKESGIMPATLARAAWALVAGSASNLSDVVFGVTLSGRNAPISGIVNMPGPTITTVPVRIDTSSGQTVSSYLQKAQVQATTMISYEQYGLQRIAKVSSDAQRATQFQTLLVVQPAGDEDFMIDESMGKFCDNANQENWFNTQPLLIEVTLGKDKITASANFDSDVIPSWLIKRLLQRLEIVMQQLDSAGPGTILDQIDSVELSEAERVGMSGNTHQEPLPSFPVQDQTQEDVPKRQPVTEVERELHAIWSQVLSIDPSDIGLDDSLFHLGGDSVSAMMIVQQARKIGVKLTVSDIFRHPTLQDVAASSIQERGTDKHTESLEPFALIGGEKLSFLRDISARYDIDESTIQNAYPCTPLQEGLISLTSKRPGAYVMQNIIKLNTKIDRFRQAWEDVVANLPILRTMIVQHHSLGLLQVVSNTVGEWSEADNLDAYIKADRARSMDIGCPLSRHAIVQDGARGDYFVWTIHHALYDGWTIKLMIQALEAALRNEVSAKWPSYQPFINYIRTQDVPAQTQYWEQAFMDYDSSPFPSLPPTIEQPTVDSVIEYQFPNPGDQSTKMGVTTSILIRAAWALVAGHTSLSDDVVFGVTLSGRNAPISDIDNMPAPTIATVPVRVNTTKTQKVTTYLESVQDQATIQIPFEHTGLHRISKVSSECQQACTFQTLLLVHPQGTTDMDLTFGSWLDTEQEADFASYSIMVELFLGKDSISGKVSFDSRVIASWQVQNLLERLESTLAQLSNANAETTLNDISAMTPQDLDFIWERNGSPPVTAKRSVHDMIQDVVEVHPTAQATHAGAGTLTWIVHPDDPNILLPPGVVGELLLEGPLTEQGYLNDKDKTVGYFIESPTWLLQGAPNVAGRQSRLYKTGDLVQYNQDGSLIHLGRKDTQVKIRGQRIELGEVEHCLTKSVSSIEQVIVEAIKPKDGKGKTILAAFIVRDSRGSKTESEDDLLLSLEDLDPSVMEVLKSQLPATMIPSVFFSMPRLPQTATGKTNRKILRDLGANYSLQQLTGTKSSDVSKIEPTTPEQKRMLDIWAAVLELDSSMIGIDDDFLHLGGDSIAAMKVAGEARQVGLQLSVADIFRTPTIRALALHTSLAPKEASHAITLLPHSGPVELSFAQGRLWFLEQLYPGLTWYLMPIVIRFRGALQLDALEESLQVIESRHDSLRSTFLTRNNVHYQKVHQFVPKKLSIVDIRSADESSLSEALKKDQATTFDLTREAGWRVTVFRLGEKHHVLSVVMHHINSDGWSIQVFRKELSQIYSAAVKGHQLQTQLPPLRVQYRDYSAWQKQKLINGGYERQLDYWTGKLQTSRPVEFLTDKPRPQTLSGMAGEHEFMIKGNMLNRIQALCKEYAVTPFVILLAAFRATHYRMTGVEDAAMGTPNANRDDADLKDMIGFFVNMLCFRLTVEDDSFESLIRQVQQQTVESFDNQDIPFEQIVSKLNRERDLSRHPIVQVVFAYHTRGTLDTFDLEGVDSELLELVPTTRFDLELHFFEEADSLKGAFVYSADLYTSATITNLLSVFMAVLEGALSEPRSKIATLPLLTAEGYTELKSMGLIQIHRTDYPRDMSIVDIFQQQATAHPDRVAVKDSISQITFATLNEKSDLVAQYLRAQSFSTETVIPVIAKRSVETIISFLGILKANMAYLPLDPNAPIERTKLVLSSIQGPTIILLGNSVRSADIQDTKSISIQSVLEDRVQPSFFQRLRTHTKPSASSLAYVLYTSGSTGKPKGVMVEHRSILRLVMQSNCTQYLTGNGAIAHMANTIFDASTLEIYMALLNGLTLVCLDHELVLDHTALQKAFSEERIGAAFFTPAHLKQILADSPMTLSQLETLMVGGDRFDTDDCIQARRVVKGHIINGYGPTENTIFSTMYHVEEGDSWANGLPIGRAISNSGAYIMDSQLNLLPLGVVGELVVTGDGLARGYTESQLNTDRFVTVNVDGEQLRAYRTGDLARFRPVDGLIEFFGRADAQVKIRGHRVELGEIEHILLGHGSVTDAVALIYQGDGQQPQLYAFAAVPSPMVNERMEADNTSHVKGGEEEKDEEAKHRQRVREELEARLLDHLPAYMIPKVITILDKMPVNANGKVDRKALVETLRTRTAPVREVREPNTKTEEKLQGIWAQVLNISSDGIGLDDSFFQLGGDSITAMKVVNEARKLGIDLDVSDMFRSDNLEDLASQALQHVSEAEKDEEPVILVDKATKSALLREIDTSGTSIRSDQVANILPLTSMQKRYIKDGYTNGLFVHYFFLDFSLDLDIERLKASLQQLLQSIPILRAAFLELQGKYWQVIPEVLDLPWVVRDVEESLTEALGDFCRADIKKVSFVEPPASFTLLRNKTEGLRLVIRFSHAQYDGSSFPAILKPLIDGYFGRPTTTGLDYSAFLAYIVRRRPASITYWKDLLLGSSLTTLQPHVSTGTQVLKPALISVHSEVTLPSLPSKFTTATLASAAWALLLAQTTGGKDIVYGHIVTGRNARICGPEEPVGACLNAVPVRATMSSSQTPRELLRLLQMQFSSMGDADSLGYDDIIENCTDWPAGTQFESLIHHANINEHPEFEFGGDKVKLEFFHTSELMSQHIMLMSYPVGNRLQFNMMANTSIMSVELAQTLVNRLCTIVSKMGEALDEPVFEWLDELRFSV
ncbi:Ff.00g129910.m01.CDS01 [Fusarium sp. VM40]|nr:Ff.00g129910.m01.CDS01 [Fusarium sp. VM40]